MKRKRGLHVLAAGCALALAFALVPGDASAQGRRGGGRVAQPRGSGGARANPVVVRSNRQVVVRSYRPVYYGSLFYDPWYYRPYYGGVGFYGGYPFAPPFYGGGAYAATSSVRVQVTPRETEVFVDGYFAGVVDDFDGIFQRLRLEPGEHTLQLFHPGYHAVEQKLYLQPGVTTRVREAMTPLAPGDPEPLRPEAGLSPVERNIEPRPLPRPGPPPSARERPEQNGRVVIEPASGFGELALRVQPSDAEVLVDGEPWQGAGPGERLTIQLGAGTHHIEIRKDGYRTYLSDVNIRDRQSLPVNVALTRQ